MAAAVAVLLACAASPASAVIGGNDAEPGEYPAVAEITFGPFLCTGTLIAPDWVLSAGHCGSVTGSLVASPVSWPPPLINVKVGGLRSGEGERVPVRRVLLNPRYFLTLGYDISLLQLRRPSSKAPVKVAGAGERSIWTAGKLATIVGWGETSVGGDLADTLQEADVPITTDSYCADAYSYDDVLGEGTFIDPATMVCAGYPQGGVDTCHGDSGGPLFGRTDGALRVVGATSFGEDCALPDRPGVYARVADTVLREWIRSHAPAGVN